MIIQICIGSACHLKGSYEVINTFKSVIEEKHLNEKIELKSSFCLGKCSQAVSIKIDSNDVTSITPENVPLLIDELIEAGEL